MTTPPPPAGWYPDPDGSGGQRYWDGSAWTEHQSPATPEPAEAGGEHVGAHRAPESTPEPEPSYFSAPAEPPAAGDDRRKLIIWFGAACAALLAVLVPVVIYGVFINKDDSIQVSSGPNSTSKSETPTPSSGSGWGTGTQTASESPTTASGSGPQASDGGLTFAVTGTETAPSVKYQDAPVEKTAQGEYFIVHMTVLNSSDQQATYLGTLQKLKAGGTTYSIDDEATAYLNGTAAQLNPTDTADVAITFDVPSGTTPESLEVHGQPMSAGVDVPLS
ncbi:MAG: DUF4352 domain-containing protein [Mycobacterium sp.]|jgi:hypothetical protein|uniref:DUF4352 domain-containing protein n=1 Tax=Mycobacterium sp. TaxID=1785 RepID=UPI00389A17DF